MNNQFPQQNQNTSMKQMVSAAMMKRLEKFLNPPETPPQEKRPKNHLWIAYVAFNAMLAFLDVITAVTVGTFTFWMYGVLVFLAGYGPLLLWEFLFIRPYASKPQKNIAIGGAIIGAISTIGVGIVVGILNVVKINSLFGAGTLEIIIVVSLVILSSMHVLLFGWYYFTDLGFSRQQKYANSLAQHDDTKEAVRQAKIIAREILTLGKELEDEQAQGRGGLVGAALTKMGHNNLLSEEEPVVEFSRNNGNHP